MANRFIAGKAYRLAVFGVLAGAALAVAAFPSVGLGGLIANRITYIYNHPPAPLHIQQNPQITTVYANDGKTVITTFYDERRHDVALNQISPYMQKAIVASEDTRFYKHGGVDLRSVARAFVSNNQGGAQQGASTLTMQYVRNVRKEDPSLTPQERVDATADNAGRKITEMRYAIAIDKKYSKQEILRRYLNIAYFGNGAYGIDAAARTYFSKPPSQLTLPEAALLAGIVQSPDVDNPAFGDRNAALSRRSYVLDAMAKMKVISPAEATSAKAAPLHLKVSQLPENCANVPEEHNDWGFFCDYLTQWWDNQPAFGRTVQDREDALRDGGYSIVTSLDPKTQAAALSQSLGVYGYGSPMALPLAVVQPGTGRIAAMAVNRHYSLQPNASKKDGYPNSTAQLVGGYGGVEGYPAGSTFKMFTMLAALEEGKKLSTGFNAPAKLQTKWYANGSASCNGYWCPANDNPSWMDGYRTMWDGFGRSVNTYFVWLEEQIGPENAVAMAQRLGITFRAPSDAEQAGVKAVNWGAFTLGVADTTPLDLANAYATLAADGQYCEPLPVLSIKDAQGRSVAAANPNCRPVLSPDIARAGLDAGRCPVGEQSAFGKCDGGTAPEVGSILGGRPVAGKTGSTENNATETFVGVTPQLAAAAIAADPDNPSDLAGEGVSSSVNTAVANTLNTALKGQPVVNFQAPSAAIAGMGE